MLLETTYLSYQRFPGIQQKELEKGPLHHLLSSRYGLKLTAAEETFEPILLRPLEAQMLKTEENALGMLVERISLEGEARVVEFSKGVSPARKFRHHITLKYEKCALCQGLGPGLRRRPRGRKRSVRDNRANGRPQKRGEPSALFDSLALGQTPPSRCALCRECFPL